VDHGERGARAYNWGLGANLHNLGLVHADKVQRIDMTSRLGACDIANYGGLAFVAFIQQCSDSHWCV
jgi:hypothetical protein